MMLLKCVLTISAIGAFHSAYVHAEAEEEAQNLPQTELIGARTAKPKLPDTAILPGFFATPDANHEPIVDAIRRATTSIRMTMFRLSDAEVVDALKDAEERGVDVQVILDKGSWNKSGNTSTVLDPLMSSKADVVASSKGFALTHEKSMVIDEKIAFVMSLNLTTTVKTTRDFGVITNDRGVISEMLSVFETDLQNAQDGTKVTPELSDVNLVWAPVNAESKLAALIDSAKKSLDVEVENINEPVIEKALTDAAARGVEVRFMAPLCDKNPNTAYNVPAMNRLASAGVQARAMPGPATAAHPYIHAKVIVVDGARSYVGSVNYTANSMKRSRELGIVISDAQAIGTLEQDYDSDWKVTVDVPAEPNRQGCRANSTADADSEDS